MVINGVTHSRHVVKNDLQLVNATTVFHLDIWCFCQRGENRASVLYVFVNTHIRYVPSWVWGWGGVGGACQRSCQLAAHARATSRHGFGVGVGWGGDVNAPMEETTTGNYLFFSKTTRQWWQRQVSFLGHQSRKCQTRWKAASWVTFPYPSKSGIEFCEAVTNQKNNVDHRWSAVLSIFECQIYPNLVGAMKLATTLKGSSV